MEIWKDVPGYEGYYQVSDKGLVKGLDRIDNRGQRVKSKYLKPITNKMGYLVYSISKNGNRKTFKAHQLVAMAFLGHKPCGMKLVIDHINFNKKDNTVDNLRIVSQRENGNLLHKKSVSKYTGVGWSKQAKKWRAYIGIKKNYIHLGYHLTEIDAHKAYTKYCEINKII